MLTENGVSALTLMNGGRVWQYIKNNIHVMK